MKNCVFTIVAKNYLGLAFILEQSIKKYNSSINFFIIVADEFEEKVKGVLPSNVFIAKDFIDIDSTQWINMSFKYDLTEFCTSIKPFTFNALFKKGYENIIYLDPDILFFSDINQIFERLEEYDIILTPHIVFPTQKGCTDSPETDWLSCGIFNLGFIAMRNSIISNNIVSWWSERLLNNCYNDRNRSEYTDQKWMNFIPAIVPRQSLYISRELGWNMAPWNFFERKVVVGDNNHLFIKRRCIDEEKIYPLIFIHFSGYNYKNVLYGNFQQNNIKNLQQYDDIEIILKLYEEFLTSNKDVFLKYINQPYSYSHYSDNVDIYNYHRRLYRGLIEKGVKLDNPFSSNNKFYLLLKKNGMLKSNVIDKASKLNVPNIGKKLNIINRISRFVFRILGAERYFILVKFLYPYSDISSHIHILSDKYNKNNIM